MTKLQEEQIEALEVIYDNQLVDDIVCKGLVRQEASGDFALYNEYHEMLEEIRSGNHPWSYNTDLWIID